MGEYRYIHSIFRCAYMVVLLDIRFDPRAMELSVRTQHLYGRVTRPSESPPVARFLLTVRNATRGQKGENK